MRKSEKNNLDINMFESGGVSQPFGLGDNSLKEINHSERTTFKTDVTGEKQRMNSYNPLNSSD